MSPMTEPQDVELRAHEQALVAFGRFMVNANPKDPGSVDYAEMGRLAALTINGIPAVRAALVRTPETLDVDTAGIDAVWPEVEALCAALDGYGPRPAAALLALAAALRTPETLGVAGWINSLRSPRNSLGKLALPKGPMEWAVQDAWDKATSWVGDPADGIEMHDLGLLADAILDALPARLAAALRTPKPEGGLE